MLITYKGTNNKIGFADEDLLNNKDALLTQLAKSNARLKEIKSDYNKESELNEKLVAMRRELYKREKTEELKLANDSKLHCKKDQIELYFSRDKSYEEIALLTDATPDYIYKVICNYRKKNKIKMLGRKTITAPTPPMIPSTNKAFSGPSGRMAATKFPNHPTAASIHSMGDRKSVV